MSNLTGNLTFAENFETISNWIILIYFANIATGALLNALSFSALLRSKRNGTLSIVLQLAAVDVLSTCVCFVEIWSLKSDTWPFPAEFCPLFSGTEILINTLILYLIVSLNFHTISLCNLKFTENRNPLTSCDASNECLVRDSRNITIDYRNRKRELSVILPCILVWFICISLSIPQFTLSSTIHIAESNSTICTLVDVYYGKLLQNLLTLFRVVIPAVLLIASLLIILWKLYAHSRQSAIQNIFTKKSDNVLYYLMFCLVLNLAYLLTSLQRLILYSMHTVSLADDNSHSYKMPPLFNNCTYHYLTLVLSMLHYSGTFFRFLIYLFLLPKFKAIICNKILLCFKNTD